MKTSKRTKFGNRLKELGDMFLKMDEVEAKRTAAEQPQQQQQAKKARTEEPPTSQNAPPSSYQKLKGDNRSMKDVLDQLSAVNQMTNLSDAHRATLITAIMREGGFDDDDAAPPSSSPAVAPVQQQQQQQQPPQQQQTGDDSRSAIPSDRGGRMTYLQEVMGPFGASLFSDPQGGMGQDFRNENTAMGQFLNQTLNERRAAGEEPGLLGFAAMGSQQRGDHSGVVGAGELEEAQRMLSDLSRGAN